MNSERTASSSIRLSEDQWWITGGYDQNGRTKSTEVYEANSNSFNDFVDLPEETYFHNIVNVNQTHLALVTHANIYLYDRYRIYYSSLNLSYFKNYPKISQIWPKS